MEDLFLNGYWVGISGVDTVPVYYIGTVPGTVGCGTTSVVSNFCFSSNFVNGSFVYCFYLPGNYLPVPSKLVLVGPGRPLQ
jgi:hypothetical protein